MIRKQLSIFLANHPGALSRVGTAFQEGNVNILGITVSDTVDHAVVRLVVDDSQKALSILEECHMLVIEQDILEATLPNKPGAFAGLAAKLAVGGINVDYAYGSNPTGTSEKGVLFLHVTNLEKAEEILKDYK